MTIYLRFTQTCRRDAHNFGGVRNWLLFRCLPALLGAGLLLLLLASSPGRAEQGAAVEPGGLEAGHLLLQAEHSGGYQPALLHDSKVHFEISGMIARVELTQTFRNPTAGFVEGVYAFPLPEDAAVRHMEMLIGERRIVGRIREKHEAKKLYQEARRAGKKASLVEQQRPNLFTNRVANIPPGEQVVVRLEYVQAIAYDAGRFSLRFPMTITPRYMPGNPLATVAGEDAPQVLALDAYQGWARPTDQVPDAHAISPLLHPAAGSDAQPVNPIEISARLDMGMPLAAVTSPYHDIALSRSAGVYSIELARGVSEMDRDFQLQWQPVAGAEPQAALFTEKVGEHWYGLLMMVPPSRKAASAALPREVTFVIDTSGSMGGVSIEQARASLITALGRLGPSDRFNVIAFSSRHRALYRSAVPATRHYVQRAKEFVRQLQASGGTEMMPALRAALATGTVDDASDGGGALKQVVFITDGAVGNEQALFADIEARLGDTRLFTVGI
ncbi:MAG: VIT domain-containing protein, partial [Halioglobus sp.]|nr:VIT domain-containing protein [Halioglobus sp.]